MARSLTVVISGGFPPRLQMDRIPEQLFIAFVGPGDLFRASFLWFLGFALFIGFFLGKTNFGNWVRATGGLGTLGTAMADSIKAAGAQVTILDRPDGAPRDGFGYLGVDLNDLAGAEKAVRRAGPFDILVNNAALIINKPHDVFSLMEYEDQIRVNSSAAFALSRVIAPHMKAQQRGKIINLTSITLNGQRDGYVPYVASKGAMLGLTKGLARELGPFGINVNAVAPGAVKSAAENRVFADRLEDYNDWVLDRQCLKTRIEPSDVADLTLFLCSNAARMISGQNVAIDGGW